MWENAVSLRHWYRFIPTPIQGLLVENEMNRPVGSHPQLQEQLTEIPVIPLRLRLLAPIRGLPGTRPSPAARSHERSATRQ